MLAGVKLRACDHCRRVGMLIGHGRLLGYAESSSERVARGHRLLCSNRHRRTGCGRTIQVWLAAVVPRRTVRTATVFTLLVAIVDGSRVAAAWPEVSSMSLRTAYRVRHRLELAAPAIRTVLCSRAPPPFVASASDDAQLVAHVRAVLGDARDPFAAFQSTFQCPLLA